MAEAVSAELLESLAQVAQTNNSVSKDLKALTKELKNLLTGKKADILKSTEKQPKVENKENDILSKEIKNLTKELKALLVGKKTDIIKPVEKQTKIENKENSNTLKEIKLLSKEIKTLNSLLAKKEKESLKTKESTTNVQKQEDKSVTDIALERKEPSPVTIFDISPSAYKKFEELFQQISGKKVDLKEPEPKKTGGGGGGGSLLGNIATKLLGKSGFGKALSSGLLSSLAGLGASLALAIGSWFNEGPWKGTMKLVGEIGTKIFIPKVTKILTQFFPKMFETFTKGIQSIGTSVGGAVTKLLPTTGLLGKLATKFLGFFTPLLKRLPVIGTIINIGSAISRFIKGDIIGGLIDLGSAIAVLIPGVGTVISLGLGLLNAGRDLTGESKKPEGEQIGNIGKILGKVMDWFKEKIKNIFNAWFGKIGKGIEQIKEGDYFRGIVTLASFVPGLWWLESLYNLLAGPPPEKPKEEGKKETLPSDIVAKGWDWLKSKIKTIFTNVFKKVGDGWKQIKSGNYFQGIITWASLIPGFGWLESVYNWVTGNEKNAPKEENQKEQEQPNILSKGWDWLKTNLKTKFAAWFSKFGRGWNQIKSGNYFQGIVTWASTIPGFGWLESLYNWVTGPEEATEKEETGKEKGFDWKSIFVAIKDSIKDKLKKALLSLKKLPFVPDKLVDKISSFLGLEDKKEESNKETAISPSTSAPTTSTFAAPVSTPPVVPVMQTATQLQDAANQTQASLQQVIPQPPPAIPLATTTNKDRNKELERLTSMFEKMSLSKGGTTSTSSRNNTVASTDNSSVNIYNLSSDRDIPYVERNKYRQQLLYIRGIL